MLGDDATGASPGGHLDATSLPPDAPVPGDPPATPPTAVGHDPAPAAETSDRPDEPSDRLGGKPRWRRWLRSELGSGLELAGLVGLAVVQPVLGPFGESPETFVGADAAPGDIVRFGLVVAFVPLFGLWLLAAATRVAGERARSWVQTGIVGLLAAMGAVATVQRSDWPVGGRVALGVAVGTLVATAQRRWEPGRLFLRYASPLPILLVGSFLLASPVASLVRPEAAPAPTRRAGDHPSVVVIVLDELPTISLVDGAGGIDADLFPNIARVAGTSTWYRDHTAVTPSTQSSLPAILTGRVTPDRADERPATLEAYPDNLITLLARTHEVHGREWATAFCPRSLCPGRTGEIDADAEAVLQVPLGSPQAPLATLTDEARDLWWSQVWPGSSSYEPEMTITGKTDADDLTRLVLEFTTGIVEQQGDRPVFEYLHAPYPHDPWTTLPTGQSYDGPSPAFGSEFLRAWPRGEDGQQLADAARVRHLLQLQWTDRLLGGVIDELQAVGRWDDAVVVLTSDHGVAFDAGQSERILGPATQVPIGWAPLFVKAPGQTEGAVEDGDVTSLDVLPTIADLAGVDLDWEHEGESLADGVPRRDRPKPMSVAEPDRFDEAIGGDLVALDADGLDAVRTAGPIGTPGDPLRVWRSGRHGDLLGEQVDELGVCTGTGPEADVERSPDWGDYLAGTLADGEPLPLWRQGTIPDDEPHDIAAVVDGRVVGWGASTVQEGENRFGILLTEPLVRDARGNPRYFEVVDGEGCRLRRLPI